MQFMLNEQEVRTMREILAEYLPELRRELARTELPSRELRHDLERRVKLCERIQRELDGAAGQPV